MAYIVTYSVQDRCNFTCATSVSHDKQKERQPFGGEVCLLSRMTIHRLARVQGIHDLKAPWITDFRRSHRKSAAAAEYISLPGDQWGGVLGVRGRRRTRISGAPIVDPGGENPEGDLVAAPTASCSQC